MVSDSIEIALYKPMLHEIIGYSGETLVNRDYDLRLNPLYDPEGLCLDKVKKRLLIACKGSPLDADRARKVFAFDLQSKQRSETPVLVIDSSDFLDGEGITFAESGDLFIASEGKKSKKARIYRFLYEGA